MNICFSFVYNQNYFHIYKYVFVCGTSVAEKLSRITLCLRAHNKLNECFWLCVHRQSLHIYDMFSFILTHLFLIFLTWYRVQPLSLRLPV